jgi:ElaB/YqjD/DUF883 family membrane-anchored ribosome-binding protein
MIMSSTPSSGQTPRSAAGIGSKPIGVSLDPASSHVETENVGNGDPSEDLSKLRRDLAGLKDNFARLVSQAGEEAVKTVRGMSQTVASQVSNAAGGVTDAGSDLASSAKEHAKTFASELEAMARRNPLGTIAGALVIGVVIGMMSRGRG